MTGRTVCQPRLAGRGIKSDGGGEESPARSCHGTAFPSESSLTAGTRLGILLALARGEC
jgi:hypothetical protein